MEEELPRSVDEGTLAQADENAEEKPTCRALFCSGLVAFFVANEFLVLVIVVIMLAKAYPPLGAEYLHPHITAKWVAVIFIFCLAGLCLKTEELVKAFKRVHFNAFVQLFNFGAVSSIVFGFSRLMKWLGLLSTVLADGMVICSCLPITVNLFEVLTKLSGGDEAAAIFNTAFSNMIGIFLSPVLILGYLGVAGSIDIGTTFYKLAVRVVLPIVVGQVIRLTSKPVVTFVKKYKFYFSKAQEYTLIFIIYTVFCQTFAGDRLSNLGDVFLMILYQFILLCTVMALSWTLLRLQFPHKPKLCATGLFGCTHKTIAIGVPLINAIYEGNPNVGLYTLPLLIWYPMQLVVGSAVAPRLKAFVEAEKKRLGVADEDEDDASPDEEQGQSEEEIVAGEVVDVVGADEVVANKKQLAPAIGEDMRPSDGT